MSVTPGTRKIGSTAFIGQEKYARGLYDFAVEGGAVSDITLRGDTIPSGAIVTRVVIDVDTVPTSAGAATIALKAEGAADLQAADVISGFPWSSTGAKNGDAQFSVAANIPTTTAARSIVATVGTAALTAGVFSVIVGYVELTA